MVNNLVLLNTRWDQQTNSRKRERRTLECIADMFHDERLCVHRELWCKLPKTVTMMKIYFANVLLMQYLVNFLESGTNGKNKVRATC